MILNAANLNLVAFSKFDADQMQGQSFALFVILIAACEAAVALAIVLKAYEFGLWRDIPSQWPSIILLCYFIDFY